MRLRRVSATSPHRGPQTKEHADLRRLAHVTDSDPFDEIIEAETDRDPDLAVIEAGSRTLRTQGTGTPRQTYPGAQKTPRWTRPSAT